MIMDERIKLFWLSTSGAGQSAIDMSDFNIEEEE